MKWGNFAAAVVSAAGSTDFLAEETVDLPDHVEGDLQQVIPVGIAARQLSGRPRKEGLFGADLDREFRFLIVHELV